MDLNLNGARVLVAASSQGLGWATARQFSREGARVVVNSRSRERAEAAAKAIQAETGGEVFAVPGDVSDGDVAADVVKQAAARMQGLDILVTNAGGPPGGNFGTTPLEEWEKTFHLLVMSAVRMIHAALPHLRHSDRAAILTVTSTSVKQPVENLILSNSVRMAVTGLTKSLADELGPEGIRINSILPGFTRTARVQELLQTRAELEGVSVDEIAERRGQGMPLRRMGQPEEFANVAVFLCSSAASYVHGAMIPVDGGALRASL